MKAFGVALLYASIIGIFMGLMFGGIARADDLPDPPTTALQIGEPAPFSGLLLSELRFTALTASEITLESVESKLGAERQANKDLKVVLDSCLRDEQEGGPWYTTFWAGAAVGVGVAILVGWLGSEAEWW